MRGGLRDRLGVGVGHTLGRDPVEVRLALVRHAQFAVPHVVGDVGVDGHRGEAFGASWSGDRHDLASRLVVGLAGPQLHPAEASWLTHWQPAGVILFARNLETPERTAALIEALIPLLRRPALIAVDQEGGLW